MNVISLAVARKKSNAKKTSELPVNLGMLHSVRDELKSDIASLQLHMESRFKDVDARFDKMEARFKEMESRFAEMESRFEKMWSKMHQMHLLMEEQAARNRIVMDGLISLFARQERIEKKIDK